MESMCQYNASSALMETISREVRDVRQGWCIVEVALFRSHTRLPRSIQAKHQQPHFFQSENLVHHLGDVAAHRGGVHRLWCNLCANTCVSD